MTQATLGSFEAVETAGADPSSNPHGLLCPWCHGDNVSDGRGADELSCDDCEAVVPDADWVRRGDLIGMDRYKQ